MLGFYSGQNKVIQPQIKMFFHLTPPPPPKEKKKEKRKDTYLLVEDRLFVNKSVAGTVDRTQNTAAPQVDRAEGGPHPSFPGLLALRQEGGRLESPSTSAATASACSASRM